LRSRAVTFPPLFNRDLNGVLADSQLNNTSSIVYGVKGVNTIAVVAVDGAGNKSAPATTTVTLQ
jgi:hypothetical protein